MTAARNAPSPWLLRIAVLLLVIGAAKYVQRDAFHEDDSILQPVVEITAVVLATCLALGAAFLRRIRPAFAWPYLLLLLTFLLAIVFSSRSWDPSLSLVRGVLLVMNSISLVALFRIYGLRPLLACVLNSYITLIALGVALAALFPDAFPLFLHDPGEEAVRSRLHLFRIHPIALADDCAICLVMSAMFTGRWMRFARIIFAACLILTVTRASIAFGLPLYLAAELALAGRLRLTTARVMGFLIFIPAMVGVGLLFAYSDLAIVDEIRTSFDHVMDATVNNYTLNGRTSLWTMLIDDLSFGNFYGYGVGGARYYLRTVNPWFGQSHNSLLETVYTAGYAGAALEVAALLGALFRLASRWRTPDARVLAVTLSYVIAAGMMNPSWYETSSIVVISVTCAGLSNARQRRPASALLSEPNLAAA